MLNPEELLKTLRSEEVVLILALRSKFRFGEVSVFMRDGIPQKILRVEIFADLKEKDPSKIQDMLTLD